MTAQRARSLWIEAKGRASIREEPLHGPAAGEVVLETLWSGISRGTERTVFAGRVPETEWERMRCPHQQGAFPFPVKYGYALVGRPTGDGDEGAPAAAFVLHPHQDRLCVDREVAHPVPPTVPPRRAILSANMETALNATWDARVGAGDRVLVVGGGVVGLLIAFLTARIPGTGVTVIDVDQERGPVAKTLGAGFALPDDAPTDQDVVFHASATEAGLERALASAGPEATVVETSWYGDTPTALSLGGAFHSRRLRLISTQVGMIPADRRSRWSHTRRLRTAIGLLAAPELDALITAEVDFRDLPDRLPAILAPGASGLMTAVRYL